MKTGTIIVVHPETGARLCNDNRWRTFANFGGYPECVKTYRYARAALNAGAKYRGTPANGDQTLASVVHLHEGDTMDAAGNVERRNWNPVGPLSPGHFIDTHA